MLDKRIAHRHLAFIHLQHLVDPSAGESISNAQHFVRGTMVQAQPAMDARGQQLPARLVFASATRPAAIGCRCGSCGFKLMKRLVQMRCSQTMNLPLFKIFFGSMARFTARIIFTSVGVVPQTSKWGLASVGQCATSADEPGRQHPTKRRNAVGILHGGRRIHRQWHQARTRLPVAALRRRRNHRVIGSDALHCLQCRPHVLDARCVYRHGISVPGQHALFEV